MDEATLEKLNSIEKRYNEVEELMADPENASNVQKITKLAKEHSELKKVVLLYKNINSKNIELGDIKKMLDDESDHELIEMAEIDEMEIFV